MLMCVQAFGQTQCPAMLRGRGAQRARNEMFMTQKVILGIQALDVEQWCSVQPQIGDLPPNGVDSILGRQQGRSRQEAR